MINNRTKNKTAHFRISNKVKGIFIISFIILSIISKDSFAQQKIESKRKIKLKNKKIEKKREKDRAAELNISEDLRQQHLSNQNKKVRKRMKKNKKRAKRYNDNKQKFFLARWFKVIKLKVQSIF